MEIMERDWIKGFMLQKGGKYWKPGSRYYGKTKQGEYLSEKEAVQKGYRPQTVRENDYVCES